MSLRVSIVLPTHNRPIELDRAVRSVLAQTLKEWELIVVDDGSTPPVHAMPRSWHGHPRVRMLRHEASAGVAAARNAAIAAARAPWIAFLDDDDLWAPEKLERQLSAVERDGALFSFGTSITVDADAHVVAINAAPPVEDLLARLWRTNEIGGPSTVMVGTELLRDVGGFAENLAVVADWDLWLRLAARAPASAVTTPVAVVVEHPGSMQRVWVQRIAAEMAVLRARHAEDAPEFGRSLGAGTTEVWLAHLRWKAGPSPVTGLRFAATAVAHREALDVAGGVVRRRLRRRRGPEAPAWAAALLRDADEPPAAVPTRHAEAS